MEGPFHSFVVRTPLMIGGVFVCALVSAGVAEALNGANAAMMVAVLIAMAVRREWLIVVATIPLVCGAVNGVC